MDNARNDKHAKLFAKWHAEIDRELDRRRHADSGHKRDGDESGEVDASAGPAPEPEPEPGELVVEGVRGWLWRGTGVQQPSTQSYNWEDHLGEYLEFLAELLNSEDSEEKTEAQVEVEMLGMADRKVVWAMAEQMRAPLPPPQCRWCKCSSSMWGGGVKKPKRTRRKKTKRTHRKKLKKSKRSKINKRTKTKRRTKR